MKTLGERLKEERRKKKWTLKQVSTKLGLKGHSTYSNWEYGVREPDKEMLAKLADLYDVSTDYLLGRSHVYKVKEETLNEMKSRSNDFIQNALTKMKKEYPNAKEEILSAILDYKLKHEELVKIPIVGTIKAGYNLIAEQQIVGYELVSKNTVEEGQYFYLIVKGDSMIEEDIREGHRVLVKSQDFVENGKIGVVLVNGDEATLKRVYYQDNHVILQASNKNIPPRILPIEEVRIQGQVKKVEFDV